MRTDQMTRRNADAPKNDLLIKEEQACEGAHHNHLDGIDLEKDGTNEGGDEEQDADPELPGTLRRSGEVLFGAEQKGGGCQQTNHGRTETLENRLDGLCLHVFEEHPANHDH